MTMDSTWTLAALSLAGAGAGGADALVLPSPLASSHDVLLRPDARHGRRRGLGEALAPKTKQRSGRVCLEGPLNVMSLDRAGREMEFPDPINMTSLVDPSMDVLDVMTLAQAPPTEPRVHDFPLPRELPVIEDEIVVIESPEDGISSGTVGDLEPQAAGEAEQDYPSVAKIVKFTLPAIGVWLCSPVLSMIDTASVGLLAGTAQQAALNPAVSVTDYGAILIAFMYTATTNLIAGAVEKDMEEGNAADKPRTTRTLVTALRLALVVGVSFGAVLGSAAPLLLKTIIGNSSVDPAVFGAALRYVRIRALGMPAAAVIGAAQSACLGMKDVRSPLYVLAAAAGINLVGDLLLVRNASPWLGGAAGAAWATVLSQYGALVMFLGWLTRVKRGGEAGEADPMEMIKDASEDAGRRVRVTFDGAKKSGAVLRRRLLSSRPKAAKPEARSGDKNDAPARGFLAGSHGPLSVLNPLRLVKSKSIVKGFLPFVVPVTTTSIGRISGYLTMSHVASSAFGTLDMAAHQIAISIFCCLAPVVDALNQVAQSFVPGIFARRKSRARALALRRTSANFVRVGALFGSVLAAAVAVGVPPLSRCFTADPAVLSRVRDAIPGIAVFLGFDGLMCVGEGTLLGRGDLSFLRNAYAAFFFLVPAVMLRLKRRALGGAAVGIGTMWGTFGAYEVVRAALWTGRVAWLQRRTEREAERADAPAP